jgi:deoxyribodipyrimidine photo-lyase
MANAPVVVWLRQDLRLADHLALTAAIARGGPVIPVYVLEDAGQRWSPGGAAPWWLHHSLAALGQAIATAGGRLVLRRGAAVPELVRLATESGATAVLWNRRYEPHEQAREVAVAEALAAAGIETQSFAGNVLFEPGAVRNQAGQPFAVFMAYWRSALALPEPSAPLPAPAHLPAPAIGPESLTLDQLGLMPTRNWWQGLAAAWTVGEAAAADHLAAFLDQALDQYPLMRDRPDQPATSRLSPHLSFGEISPRQIWHAVKARDSGGAEAFLRELGWREFSIHLLDARPDLPDRPMRPEFADFAWEPDERRLRAWQQGRTGFPMVDAGMRQLRGSGWMHNRVRMIAASFLIKDLLIAWQQGEDWFWDNLVDADLAANAASWQWVAGCGIDSAPYFRIFNPVLQGEKFDPRGRYVRQWVPELARMPDIYIHKPWEAPPSVLAEAGLREGDYPRPIVDHRSARRRALDAYGRVRGGTAQ